MDKKLLLPLTAVVLSVIMLAGCLGGSESTPETKYKQETGQVDPQAAWAESNWADSDTPTVDTSLRLGINSSEKVTEISVTISFEDSDASHSETDDGSDADDIVLVLTNGDNTSQPAVGQTPCTLTVKMNSTEDGGYMGGEWEVQIQATCNGGKPATLVPRPGIIPGPFVYKDQGVAYSLSGEYGFLIEVTE